MLGRVTGGFVTGLLWFFVLSAVEGRRWWALETGPDVPWGALVSTLLVTVAVLWLLLRFDDAFRAAVTSGFGLLLTLGLVYVATHGTGDHTLPDAFAIPTSFSRGALSVTVWTAFGTSTALTFLLGRASRARPRLSGGQKAVRHPSDHDEMPSEG